MSMYSFFAIRRASGQLDSTASIGAPAPSVAGFDMGYMTQMNGLSS